MHLVLGIEPYPVTRWLDLQNLETGTVDNCFDDSDMKSEIEGEYPFAFIEIGKTYACKICLFGRVLSEQTPDTVTCEVVQMDVMIGNEKFVEVAINKDRYYLTRSEVPDARVGDRIFYRYSRKDLIQVDDAYHWNLFEY